MKRYLQCAEQHEPPSNFTKYCACHANWISWLIRVTYEMLFTRRGVTKATLQLHQILSLPRKMNLMIDPRRIWNVQWNVIYTARSKRSHPPTSPNTAPATKFWIIDFSGNSLNCFRQYKDDSTTTRAWSEDNPRIESSSRTCRFGDLTCPMWESHFVWKNNISRSGHLPKFQEMLRLPRKVTLQLHQILPLPRKTTLLDSTLSNSTLSYSILSYCALSYSTLSDFKTL